MSAHKSKSAARVDRRSKRSRNDEALMRLVQNDEILKPATKPRAGHISPLNDAQRRYDAAIRSSEIIFGIGPAGTGKTWLAAMRAAEMLKNKSIEKIVVTRPAVEAGERLGFLPGELDEKFEPYFRPVRDAFGEFFGSTTLEYLIKVGKIEARPLALLRGATIKNAWLIADEMQNATKTQFKMLLSRIGENAKFVVNGDPRQSDLPAGTSGLMDAVGRLKSITGVKLVEFTKADIVRSGLCQAVVEAYDDDPADNDNTGVLRTLKAS